MFAAGRVGERFCVRNSGALAVAEGAGDHCCEYMTAGIAVILGETGRNFGAGMTNGVAYVYDEADVFARRYNAADVGIERVESEDDAEVICSIVQRHFEVTGSRRAHELLSNWDASRARFWKVVPHPARGKQQTTVLSVKAQAPRGSGSPR
jgi:glutamate synthase domain-containing protein 3